MSSKSFGSKRPALPHLVTGTGGLSGEVSDLRNDIEEAFVTLETPGHGGTSLLAVDEWTNPLAVNDAYVKTTVSATTALQTFTTMTNATLPHARNLIVTCTVTGTGEGVVVVTGVDINGAAISETFTVPANTGVVTGNKAFKSVTRFTVPAKTVGMTGLDVKIGAGGKLGLGSKIKLRNAAPAVLVELSDAVIVNGGGGSAVAAVNQTTIPTNQNTTPVITVAKVHQQQNLGALVAAGVAYHAQYAAGAAIADVAGPFTRYVPPRTVQIARGGAGVATIYTVTGTDPTGAVLTEVINSNGAATVQGTKAFTTITGFASNVNPTVTTDLQTGNGFGLAVVASDIDAVGVNGVLEAPTSVDVATGTVIPASVPNAARVYTVDYRKLPTATQAAHTHVQDAHLHVQDAHTHPGGGVLPGTYVSAAVGLPNGTYTPATALNGAHDYALVYERDLS
jgi:hypothetical protein